MLGNVKQNSASDVANFTQPCSIRLLVLAGQFIICLW